MSVWANNNSLTFLFIAYQPRPLKRYHTTVRFLIWILIVVAFAGCSRKKSGFTHRLYHNTTSHYNWYFNANEIMKQTRDQLWANKQDNYLELLPIYVLPDEEGQKNLTPQMDAVIEKCGTIIDRHSMEIKRKEYNKWIDNAYLLIGIANYYKGNPAKTEEMTSYVAKKYKGEDARYDAALWLARTYIDAKRYGKANTVLSVVENDESEDRPKDFAWKFETVYAYMYLKQDRYGEAIPRLEDAAAMCTDKRMAARLTYILAQCLQREGRSADAIDAYARVVDMKPDYEMEFYAKISQALAYDRRLNSEKIKEMLIDMAKDEKNVEYYDQIYYALADIALEEQDVAQGIEYLETSIAKSVSNNRQKGMSYLRLAELYFEDRAYRPAESYYDSAATTLPEDYPDYEAIVAKGASLDELVTNIETVERNDSLLALAAMDESEREKKLLRIIADLEAEAERKKQEELAALERIQAGSSFPSAGGSSSSGKDWYFYNAGALGSGFQEFKRRWGNRELEDNWRRATKNDPRLALTNPDAAVADSARVDAMKKEAGIKSLEEYLAELPLDDSSQASLYRQSAAALYDIGTIYKERLKDADNATEAFVRITQDFENSAVAPDAYYQLYRIYVEKEQSGGFVGTGLRDNSAYYKEVILNDYPDSEYAKLILNPDYVTEQSRQYQEQKAAYEELYKKYTRRQYSDVLLAANTVIRDEPDNNFLSKYYLVKALTIGERRQPEAYEEALREVVSKFGGTPEAEKAAELLGILNEAKAKLNREKLQAKKDSAAADKTTAEGLGSSEAAIDSAATSMFNVDDGSDHFFALIFPKEGSDGTELKNAVSDFNTTYFKNDRLRLTNSFIDKERQILIVRSFSDKESAMEYYRSFVGDENMLKSINEQGYQTFVITTKNFTTLFRNKNPEVYGAFFESNYLP